MKAHATIRSRKPRTPDARRIGPAGRTSRRYRRFPYRAADPTEEPAVRDLADEVLRQWTDLVWLYARRRFQGIDAADLEDAVQEAMLVLGTYSLSRYDAWSGASIQTFLGKCAFNALAVEGRRRKRRLARDEHLVGDPSEIDIPAPDRHADRQVEAFAEALTANPERYLTRHQARAVRVVGDHPDLSRTEQSRLLGYSRPSSLSMRLAQARHNIIEAAEAEGVIA